MAAVAKFDIISAEPYKDKYDNQFTIVTLCYRFSGISLKTLKQLVAAFNGMNISSSLAYSVA